MILNKALIPAALLPSLLVLTLSACAPGPEKSDTELSPPDSTTVATTETSEKAADTTLGPEGAMTAKDPRPANASKKEPDWRPITSVKSREKGDQIAEIFLDKNSIVKDGEKYSYVMHAKNLSHVAAVPNATSLEGTFSGTCGKDSVTIESETYFDAKEKVVGEAKTDLIQKIPAGSPGALIQDVICKDMAQVK